MVDKLSAWFDSSESMNIDNPAPYDGPPLPDLPTVDRVGEWIMNGNADTQFHDKVRSFEETAISVNQLLED